MNPKWSGGAPRRIDEQTRAWICAIARCDPRFLGQPFSCWSLAKLRAYLIDTGRVQAISIETVRRILHERGISWQATKTWKASTDPDFTTKMRQVLDLYDHPPADGRVVCVDEFGPLNLQPRPGRAWRQHDQPARQRATYTRDQGVRHMIAALDLATGRMHYRIRDRKRWREFLSFLKTLRHRWPNDRLPAQPAGFLRDLSARLSWATALLPETPDMKGSLPGVRPWAVLAAHGTVLAVLPSGIWRILAFVAGVPLLENTTGGHDGPVVFDGVWYLLVMTAVSELLAYLTVGLVAPWGEVVPRWIPWLGGRSIPVGAASVSAGIGATVLTLLWTYSLGMLATGHTIQGGTDVGLHLHSWQYVVFWVSYGPLVLWGPLLGAVTIHYYRRRRRSRSLPELNHASANAGSPR